MLHREPLATTIDEEQDEYLRMLLMLQLYRPRPAVKAAIKGAYDASDWDWRQCDGCTGVSEMHSPKGMRFPPCVQHDYWCALSLRAKTFEEACGTRSIGDRLFLWGNIDFRVSLPRAFWRYGAVRLYWLVAGRRSWREARERADSCSAK